MSAEKPKYIYKAHIDYVVDGDTVDATCDIGFGISCKQRFRLHGVDTPETWRPKTLAEKEHGEEAKLYVKSLIENNDVIIKTYKLSIYGRYEAEIWTMNAEGEPVDSLAELLQENDLLKYDSYPDDKTFLAYKAKKDSVINDVTK